MKIFSIIIPFYFRNNKSLNQLKRAINSIKIQNFNSYEVILSVQNYYDEINNDPFFNTIKILDARNIGGFIQGNINNGIKFAKAQWLIFLFADDYLFSPNFLETIFQHINSTTKWGITGSFCTFNQGKTVGSPLPLIFHKNILSINTVGSPSGIFIKNEKPVLFDVNSWMKLDVDYYLTLYKLHGKPLLIKNIFVVNEIHKDQFSYLLKKSDKTTISRLKEEDKYLMKKHNYKMFNKYNLFIIRVLYKLLKIFSSITYRIFN